MATWGDAVERRNAAFIAASHFESTAEEERQRISAAFDEIGNGVMEDRGLSVEEVEMLPRDTTLGPKAETAYKRLVQLVG